jgi:hypothetical protein
MKYKCRRYYELDCRTHTIGPYKDGGDPSITELYTKTWSYVKHGRGNIKAQRDRYHAKIRDIILEKQRVKYAETKAALLLANMCMHASDQRNEGAAC